MFVSSPPPPVRRKVAKKSRPAASAGEKEEGQAELLGTCLLYWKLVYFGVRNVCSRC